MTERLYYTDSRLLKFTGQVVEISPYQTRQAVVLDRTAFYPTSGGQPHDTGQLNGVPVIDVVEEENAGRVLHIVGAAVDFGVGDPVTGVIDWRRRLDHMQQHTGQHILSQAFVRVTGGETKSFHLGAESSTIDLAWEEPVETLMRQAEELANEVIFENRAVKIHQVPSEELSQWPIRRDTYHGEMVRLIEISDFDVSPCCGTHGERTGEVGLIAIRGWERAKKMCRVEFVCGGRALSDYHAANVSSKAVAVMLSTARDDIGESVKRLLEENKRQRRRIRELYDMAAEVEADELLRAAEPQSGYQLVKQLFRDRSMDEARVLARKLCEHQSVVALFGLEEHGEGRLLFARSADLDLHMGKIMKRVTGEVGGRGGGKPDMAQGGISQLERLPASLDLAGKEVIG